MSTGLSPWPGAPLPTPHPSGTGNSGAPEDRGSSLSLNPQGGGWGMRLVITCLRQMPTCEGGSGKDPEPKAHLQVQGEKEAKQRLSHKQGLKYTSFLGAEEKQVEPTQHSPALIFLLMSCPAWPAACSTPCGSVGGAGQEWELPTALQAFPKSCAPIPLPHAGTKRATYLQALPSSLISGSFLMVIAMGPGEGGLTPCSLPLITQVRKPLCTGF